MDSVRSAFILLGIMSFIVYVGVFLILSKKSETPSLSDNNAPSIMSLSLTSPAFKGGELIPPKYTCDGENISPELRIDNAPEGTRSFVLVMDDPDIPDAVKQSLNIEKFDHWAMYNIPATTTVIAEGAMGGDMGLNSQEEAKYTGACPPDREHRYFFRLYALSDSLNFTKTPSLDELEQAAQGIMLEKATLMGRYERKTF